MKIEELQKILGLICEYTDEIKVGYDEKLYFLADMPTDLCLYLMSYGWEFEKDPNSCKLQWHKEVN